jgi:hypothetical protein
MRKTTNIERALEVASTSPETQVREVDAVSSEVQKEPDDERDGL